MRSATEYFNLDTNLMTMEDYEKAALRLLVVFPSPATTKSVSMTASVLNDFVISECPGVFIDFAFVPEQDDLSTFDKYMMPYAIGNITGLDASHYDLVGFSISILFEAMTTAMIVNSFSRCDRPIPLTWSERKDHKFGETPALYLGGITASVTDVLFGDVGDGRQAFVDFIHLGEFHCVKDFFDHCIESKKLGRTVQENLDTFWPLSPSHNWLYQPQAYKVTYNDRNQIISNIKINPNAPDMCQPYYPDEIPHLNGAARGIIQGNGGNAGLGQFMAANGCSRSGFCNFCHEGAFTGGWVENTPDRLVELAKIARRYTAATTLKAYSFNQNYLSDYKRSIYDWMSIFPRVTFNNMRLEELGLDPDALKMMKLSGYKRMTAPLEGVSQRVRNNFLNKNLSEKAIDAYLSYGMMMGAVECKIGIVLTGFEEDQDWQEFFDFNEKWQKKAREMGGKIPFRYNMTYLVHYPHTPAEYWERRSVRTALYGGFLMPFKWNKRMTDNKIRIKINGFKHSTLIEQALIDLGRELTSWLYQYLVKPGYPIYSFKPVVNRKEAWEELVSRINIDYFFNERKFDEYISVSHRIHVALHANVILQAMRTLQGGLNAQPTIRCLKTYDGCPVECKANAFARNPLITYGDAWINDKGKLEGVVWEEVKGCQRCRTVEDRKNILTRTLPKSKTANDILSFKAPALRLRLRFRVERNEPYDILSPRNTAFSSLSMFLKESQELTDMFWELENNYNMYWQSEKEYFYTASGQLVYDVTFRDRKAKEIVESLIETVNAKAKTFRVIAVSEVPIDSQIKPTDLNVFYFESTIPAELWQYASMMYKGEVKAEDESGMMATKTDSSLRPPQFTLEDKVKGYFVLPCRYSPWCYLQGLMSSKRVALRRLLKTTKVRCLTTVRETNIPCVCGKENAVVDMATGLYKPVGLDCLVNWFTNNIKK